MTSEEHKLQIQKLATRNSDLAARISQQIPGVLNLCAGAGLIVSELSEDDFGENEGEIFRRQSARF
jgi:hypothetical protein